MVTPAKQTTTILSREGAEALLMADDKYTFEQARIRLEEIATEVRKKDTSLEKSLDLLEEGVRLANICTELVDHTDTSASVVVPRPDEAPAADDDAPGQTDTVQTDEDTADVPAPGEDDEGDGFEDADEAADAAEVTEAAE
ncbi:exodeoxyribonuclease VII small subunit [bacterium]|nr:exodeoxyribonuclease VII small subunit [bacterium]